MNLIRWSIILPAALLAGMMQAFNTGHSEGKQSNTEGLRYFFYMSDLYELIPKGEVRIHPSDLIFVNGYHPKKVSREEKDSLFPDSTASDARMYRNDSLYKTRLYVPVSRNRWYLCSVQTLIPGRSGRILKEGSTGTTTFMFLIFDKPAAGLVRIRGSNLCFIMPL